MRGNKGKHRYRTRFDEDDEAYEREYMERTPPPEYPTCPTGKVPILSPGHAAAVAKKMRHAYADPMLEPYRCPACPYWHVGHAIGSRAVGAAIVAMARVPASLTMNRAGGRSDRPRSRRQKNRK
jgi:hypothetical protein